MDKFLEIYNLPTLNQEEIDNLKRPVISNEIEFVLNQKKKISSKQKYTDNITGEFHQTYKEKLTPILLKLFQKLKEDGIFSNLLCEANITVIPKPDKDIRKKKRNYRTITSGEHKCKNVKVLNKILANQIQQYKKESYTTIKQNLFQGYRVAQYSQINQYDTPY